MDLSSFLITLMILGRISVLVGLICYVLVLVKMFQNRYTALAIASILTLFICGIGYFLAFGLGWSRARPWNIKTVMIYWTICLPFHLGAGAFNARGPQGPQQMSVPSTLPRAADRGAIA